METLFLLLVFLLPFERIPTLTLSDYTLKLSYLAGLGFLLFAFSKLKTWLRKYPLLPSDKALVLFWVLSLFSLAVTPNLKRSLVITVVWAFMFAIYLVASRLIVATRMRVQVEQVIMWSALAVSLFGLYQFVGDSLGLSAHLTGGVWFSARAIGGFRATLFQ
jgi:hypothetical protein